MSFHARSSETVRLSPAGTIYFIEPVSGEDALGTVLKAAPQPGPQSQGCRSILFGRGSWVWSDSMVKAVEGFHNRIVRRLANRMPRLADGEWHYPPISEAFQIVRIMPIQHYINARRATLRQQVIQRPIWRLCRNTPRTPGSSNHKMWWEQDMVEPSPLEALLSDEVSTSQGTSL